MKQKKKKRRLKKWVYVAFVIIVILVIGIISLVNYLKLINSYPYKLEKLGYNEEQSEIILKLKDENIEDILTRKYNKNIPNFAKQTYFMYKNLDSYLAYYKEHRDQKFSYIVTIVNVKANYEWYDEDQIEKTDIEKGNLMLVNKFNYLDKNYKPKNIVAISNQYCYGENSASEEAFRAFKNMFEDAKKEDLTLIITSSYRDFETQDYLWNMYAESKSEAYADSVSARAGYSEHQTGLTFDIVTYNTIMNDFEKTDEFKWLKKNAYKYGFIMRYPKGKEDITGYDYESWHYRYVGVDVATAIHEKGITYDEYYAYYIVGDK